MTHNSYVHLPWPRNSKIIFSQSQYTSPETMLSLLMPSSDQLINLMFLRSISNKYSVCLPCFPFPISMTNQSYPTTFHNPTILIRGLCDELITRIRESYRQWCVVVYDLEISWRSRPRPTGDCRAKNKQKLYLHILHFAFRAVWCNC
jgi:hypothetical protein